MIFILFTIPIPGCVQHCTDATSPPSAWIPTSPQVLADLYDRLGHDTVIPTAAQSNLPFYFFSGAWPQCLTPVTQTAGPEGLVRPLLSLSLSRGTCPLS